MKQFLESTNLIQTITTKTAEVNEVAKSVVAGLHEKQLNWKPAADRWSIAQCLEHLTISNKAFDRHFAAAIDRGRVKWPVRGAVAYHPTVIGGWLIRQLLPDSARRVPAPKIFKPVEGSVLEGALDRFLEQQNQFLKFVRQAEGIDYNKARLRSPVTALIRYSVADAFVVNVVHPQRHLLQAQRVRDLQSA